MVHYHINQIKELIEEKFRPNIIHEISEYVRENVNNLRGMSKPRNFVNNMVLLTLYKYTENIGYDKIVNTVNLGYTIVHLSKQHNISNIRKALKVWSKKHIHLGNSNDWKYAARNCHFTGEFSNVNLWIDSTDFELKHTKDRSPSSDYWSGKECYARGVVRKLWNGYTPKLFDGHFLQANHDYFEENFQGGHIIGDNHFSLGKKVFHDPVFYTNYAIQSKKRKRHEDDAIIQLAKKKLEYNNKHSSVKA